MDDHCDALFKLYLKGKNGESYNVGTGKNLKKERLDTLMQEGGISSCGNAQNCVEACPRSIPLTESIAHLGKDVSKQMWKNIFGA